jgi:L-asparagine transporter-like permease
MIDIDLIQKRLVNLIFLTILLYHLRFLRMKGYNKSMSKNKTRTFGISWWIGLVLFAGMICLMLGDILHRDGVIGSKTDVLVMGANNIDINFSQTSQRIKVRESARFHPAKWS